jgi:heme A synthase
VKPTRARDLVIAGLIAAVLLNVLVTTQYDSLPPLPVPAGLTLGVLAVVEAVFAFILRARLKGKEGTRPVQPQTAVRAVALAKASSLFGAIMTGAWVAVLVYVLPKRGEIPAASGDTRAGAVGAVCAVALIAAALWLEYNCRAPQDDDRREEGSDPSRPY